LAAGAGPCGDISRQLGNAAGTSVNRVADLDTPIIKILTQILNFTLKTAGTDEVRFIGGVVLEAIDRHRLPLF
jgi:hypothetical protein